jgi:hypothetical protein
VRPGSPFAEGTEIVEDGVALRSETSDGTCYGHWNDVQNRYLGFEFLVKGKTHFGWARLNVKCSVKKRKAIALLTGYAYESDPDTPIITGKIKGRDVIAAGSATLGHLAQGAMAIQDWRVKQVALTTH